MTVDGGQAINSGIDSELRFVEVMGLAERGPG